jgi:hypothetical protein
VMDRPARKLQFPDVPAAPKLVSVTISGSDAGLWHDRLRRWLHRSDEPVLRVGDVDLRFERTQQPGVRATPAFAVPAGAGRIPLNRSSIEFISSSR